MTKPQLFEKIDNSIEMGLYTMTLLTSHICSVNVRGREGVMDSEQILDGCAATNARGRPFDLAKRHPTGRPKGDAIKRRLQSKPLLDNEAEALTRKVIELALAGNMAAIRLCFERLLPPRR